MLLLRGPQTIGELRGRCERLHHFDDTSEVLEVIGNLEEQGLVLKCHRQPGQKECRYAHLFSGKPVDVQPDLAAPVIVSQGNTTLERIAELEKDVSNLKGELSTLTEAFNNFKKEFE